MEGDCNADALITVSAPIMRTVYIKSGSMHTITPCNSKLMQKRWNTMIWPVLQGEWGLFMRARGLTGKFFRGGKVIFPYFFFGKILGFSHFGGPLKSFSHFLKVKSKKKMLFPQLWPLNFWFSSFFLFSIFPHFPPSLFHFSSFFYTFSIFSLFSLPHFSQFVTKNFLVESLGGHSAPPPTP